MLMSYLKPSVLNPLQTDGCFYCRENDSVTTKITTFIHHLTEYIHASYLDDLSAFQIVEVTPKIPCFARKWTDM